MRLRHPHRSSAATLALLGLLVLTSRLAAAQPPQDRSSLEKDPAAALASLLSAACRANENEFASYLTADSAAAFRGLSEDQRTQLMKRFSLSDSAGRPLLSSDMQNQTVLRCETSQFTVEYRFGTSRLRENLAFIPVTVVDGQKTDFGMVREGGGWKLLSLGLVLIDIPQLTKQWTEQDLEAREEGAIDTLRAIADAIETYRRAYGKLPDTLAQLGPAPKGEVSPDQASLVSDRVAAGDQGGYRFRYRLASSADQALPSYEIAATPDEYGRTGRRSFFRDSTGKIHGADKQGGMASQDDPTLANEKTQ
jgi:hypothetical protein